MTTVPGPLGKATLKMSFQLEGGQEWESVIYVVPSNWRAGTHGQVIMTALQGAVGSMLRNHPELAEYCAPQMAPPEPIPIEQQEAWLAKVMAKAPQT